MLEMQIVSDKFRRQILSNIVADNSKVVYKCDQGRTWMEV